ncbi:hypothetical protein XH93_42095 [Bradyrhizobium sp. CCBAU 51753]|nr:hypothetical protein XH93_42095 [Bradyrhizobium sp. CCBAU 51753]
MRTAGLCQNFSGDAPAIRGIEQERPGQAVGIWQRERGASERVDEDYAAAARDISMFGSGNTDLKTQAS